ncbi:MAG: hypothetical protein PWP27_1028 [Clostridiales bacterium]|jgi:hypothetical protein|nr:hypothetical protein [Clostridiales bacterium]MDK2933218.1 hypothetical protein [Clostridiales bacterium]
MLYTFSSYSSSAFNTPNTFAKKYFMNGFVFVKFDNQLVDYSTVKILNCKLTLFYKVNFYTTNA